jgi:hypothetical protein
MSVEILDWVGGKFCKKAAENELGRESRRWKILSSVAKYWAVVKMSGEDKPIRKCYEWWVGKLRLER